MTQSVDESLERLGLDYIDLIQCHDIEFTNLEQIAYETLPALQKLKVKIVLISNSNSNFIRMKGKLDTLESLDFL